MDVVTIRGVGRYEMQTDDGRKISGFTFHGTMPSPKVGFIGNEVMKFSLTDAKLAIMQQAGTRPPTVDDVVVLEYNRYGKVDSCRLVDPKTGEAK